VAILVNQSEFRRRELSRTLQRVGFAVVQAADLEEAHRELRHGGGQLIVSDLRLGHEGAAGFHEIRRRHSDVVLLLTSAVAADHAEELAQRAGAHACWLEPFRRSDLQRLLSKWRPSIHS